MAMSQNYDEQLLLDYVEGELGKADRARVERMIEQDARLGRLLQQLQADRQIIRNLPEPPTPQWLMDEAIARLERSMLLEQRPAELEARVNHQRSVARRLIVGLAVAAMLLVSSWLVISSLIDVKGPETDVAVAPPTTTGPASVPKDDEWSTSTAHVGRSASKVPGSAPAPPTAPVMSKGAGAIAPEQSESPRLAGQRLAMKTGSPDTERQQTQSATVAHPSASKARRASKVSTPTVVSKGGSFTPANQQASDMGTGSDRSADALMANSSAQAPTNDQPIELSQLARQVDQLSPEELAALELVVKTRDVKLADAYLNRATANVKGSSLMGPLASDNGQHKVLLEDAQHMPQVNYNLQIPVDRFEQWIHQISHQQNPPTTPTAKAASVPRASSASADNHQQFFFQRRVVRQLHLERIWPRRQPDYSALLEEQLPRENPIDQAIDRQVIQNGIPMRNRLTNDHRLVTIPVIIDNEDHQAARAAASHNDSPDADSTPAQTPARDVKQ